MKTIPPLLAAVIGPLRVEEQSVVFHLGATPCRDGRILEPAGAKKGPWFHPAQPWTPAAARPKSQEF